MLCLLGVAGGVLAACSSPRDAYREGMEAEVSGDYDAAVRRYVAALRRADDLPNARGRLVVASREAVRGHLAAAAVAPDARARAEAWLAADGVVTEAASVGVDAERPPSFEADRDAALDAAVAAVLADAAEAYAVGTPAEALAQLDRAARFRPSAARRAEIGTLRRDALVYAAEGDLAEGRFRAALRQADAAAAVEGVAPTHDVDLLRDRIREAGMRSVALLPAADDAGGYPPATLDALDDAVERAVAADPFLVPVDRARVRRVLAERGAPRDHAARAAWLATRLPADDALLVRVLAPETTERARQRRRISTRLRGGGRDTVSFIRQNVEVRVDATADVVLYDPARRTPVCSERVRSSNTQRIERGVYAGDWRTLDLTAEQRAWFDPTVRARAEREAHTALAGALADRAAERARACLTARVP